MAKNEKTLKLGDKFTAVSVADCEMTLHDVVKDNDGVFWAIGLSPTGVPHVIDEDSIDNEAQEPITVFLPNKGRK